MLGLHGSGHTRVASVGADDDPGTLDNGAAVGTTSAHTGDQPVLDQHVIDGEALADLDACAGRSLDEDRVEQVRRGA